MTGKYSNKKKKSNFFTILKMAFFTLMALAAVFLGSYSGDRLGSLEFNVLEKVDVSIFKNTLNNSLPVIDAVYNSGNLSISFSGEIKNLIKGVFNFDISSPITIINSNSPIFHSYYNNKYKNNLVAKKEEEYKLDYSDREVENRGGDADRGRASSIATEEPGEKPQIIEPSNTPSSRIALINETKFKITDDTIDQLLKTQLHLKQQKKGPQILIVHTHTSEGYLQDIGELNKANKESYTRDARYNVVRVGEELAQNLRKKYGIEVLHSAKIHDEDFNSSYEKSMSTVSSYLKSFPSIRMVIDLHRDGLGKNKKLRTAVKIGDTNAARVMFVIGTSQTLSHPNWNENFKLAIKLQNKLDTLYPGLSRPIDLSYNRYNQHLSNGGVIVELGGDGDTLDEALETTKYLARVISEVIK